MVTQIQVGAQEELYTHQDILNYIFKYFDLYGGLICVFFMYLTNWNIDFIALVSFDYISFVFQSWYFKDNYCHKNFSNIHWLKKLLILPWFDSYFNLTFSLQVTLMHLEMIS